MKWRSLTILLLLLALFPGAVESQSLRVLTIPQGGTGTSTLPSLGQVLVGNSSGGYNLVATSSLGIAGGAGGSSNWLFNGSRLSPSTTVGIGVFSSSTITDLSSTNSTSTNAVISTSLRIFGTLATALSDLCTGITGGAGLCDGVDADTTYTAGDALTLTGTDIDFDGGATPSGDLGGTWASPSVTDDSHAHTGATLSAIDVSDDLNLTGGAGLTLTGDDMACDTASGSAFGCLLAADWTSFNGRISSTSLDTSSELAALLGDETGTSLAVFNTNPLLVGLRSSASSTIGDGTNTGGLHINGKATTTNLLVTQGATTTGLFSTTASSTNLWAAVVNLGSSIISISDMVLTGAGRWVLSAVELVIQNASSITLNQTGEIAIDTTAGQFQWYDGTRQHNITGTTSPSLIVASTTKDAAGRSFNTATTSILVKNWAEPMTLNSFYCKASSTGSVLIRIGDGTNWTNAGTCSTTGTLYSATSNNTFTAYEDFMVEIGTSATNPSWVTITTNLNRTSQ